MRGTAFVVRDDSFGRGIGIALRASNVAIVEIESPDQVTEAMTHDGRGVVLLGSTRADGDSLSERLARFRERDLWTSVVLSLGVAQHEVMRLPQFVRAGVDDMVLIRGDGWERELSRLVTHCLDHNLGPSITQTVLRGATGVVRSEQGLMLRRARWRLEVEEVAAQLGVSRKAMRDQHRRAGRLLPGAWIERCRMVHVAHQIDETDLTFTLIAKRLGFPDESVMSHFVRRVTGSSPSLLRSEGAMRRTLELSTRTHV